jgi:hypothetical protein
MTTDSLIFLLNEWGYYVRSGNDAGIGYYKRNIIHKMMKEGAGSSQSTSNIGLDISPEFDAINICYGLMNSKLRDVIKYRYVYKLSKRKAAIEAKMNREKYRQMLCQAESNIDGYLKAKLN